MKSPDLKDLEKKLRNWDRDTREICELLSDIFQEPKPDDETTLEVRELLIKYDWDNRTLNGYVIPEIDGV